MKKKSAFLNPALVILTFLILLSPKIKAQQAFTFTQYMNNLAPYNAAYSSINPMANVNAMGRVQWVGIEGAPRSFLLNGSLPFEKINGTGGIIIRQDKFSVENQTAASFFFAKAVQIGSNQFMSVALHAGFQNYKATYSQLDPTDPEFRDDLSESSATTGGGLMFYQPDKFYAGISIPSYNLKSVASTRMKNTVYFSGGFLQDLGDSILIKPAVLVSYVKNIPVTADISTTVYFKNIGIGINYRSTNDIGGVLSYLKDNFRIGYSYEAGLGANHIGNMSSGTHELSLGLFFGYKTIKPGL